MCYTNYIRVSLLYCDCSDYHFRSIFYFVPILLFIKWGNSVSLPLHQTAEVVMRVEHYNLILTRPCAHVRILTKVVLVPSFSWNCSRLWFCEPLLYSCISQYMKWAECQFSCIVINFELESDKCADWGVLVDVVGYCFLKLGLKYQPQKAFAEWIQQGPKPIYIGFGSMVCLSWHYVMIMITNISLHRSSNVIILLCMLTFSL